MEEFYIEIFRNEVWKRLHIAESRQLVPFREFKVPLQISF